MINRIREYMDRHNMIQRGDTIILGISGGADSVCLLFVLLELKELYECNIVGVHVNHSLRGVDAMRDQAYVEELCAKYQIPCIVAVIDVKEEAKRRKRSLEEAGREVRQEAFEQAIAQLGAERVKIATAHHANDNAETMLMNLARGTGISGLAGIAPLRGNRIRPLLAVSREEIEQYLELKGVAYCIDATNAENIYTRNIIRNQVIPCLEHQINGQTVAHINQAVEEMRKVESYLKLQVDMLWAQCVRVQEDGSIVVDQASYATQPEIIQARIVKRAIEICAGKQRDITRVHVEQVMELFAKQVGREIHLPYKVRVKRIYQGVAFGWEMESKQNVLLSGMNLVIPGKTYLSDGSMVVADFIELTSMEQITENPYTKYFDYDIITEALCIRTRGIGDYIVINTKGNKQTLKKYYIANKIPESQRDQIPLLVSGNEVLWVIGYRKGSGNEVKEQTKKVLRIQYDGGNHGRNS